LRNIRGVMNMITNAITAH